MDIDVPALGGDQFQGQVDHARLEPGHDHAGFSGHGCMNSVLPQKTAIYAVSGIGRNRSYQVAWIKELNIDFQIIFPAVSLELVN